MVIGLLAQAKVNDYKKDVYKKRNRVKDIKNYNDKIKISHDDILRCYVF